ncbi:hypothetical protein KBC79_07025 [Candidatus Woesebacteria bacterium]|nr:hypothetical protein [Candidatus Woesebacteria bacterium]
MASNSDVQLVIDGNTYYLSTTASASSQPVATASTGLGRIATSSSIVADGVPRGFAASLPQYLTFILTTIMVIAILLVLFQFVSAGVEWITSGGEKGKTEGARNKIVAAIVGIIILSSTYALAQLLVYILGLGSFDTIFQQIPQLPQ